jgi:hypothetical protein
MPTLSSTSFPVIQGQVALPVASSVFQAVKPINYKSTSLGMLYSWAQQRDPELAVDTDGTLFCFFTLLTTKITLRYL